MAIGPEIEPRAPSNEELPLQESKATQFFYILVRWLCVGLVCLLIGIPLAFYVGVYAPLALIGLVVGIGIAYTRPQSKN